MTALVYNGPREVSITEVADARIEAPTDVLVKVTSTNICGSDLQCRQLRC
jgi:threonine dehydrogenase-like Zn-dependent dehydrogenase